MIAPAKDDWTTETKWAGLDGDWTFTGENARYAGEKETPQDWGVALSSVRFQDGVVHARMCFEGPDSPSNGLHLDDGNAGGILLGYHPESRGYLVAGLGWRNAAYSIWECVPRSVVIPLTTAGSIGNLRRGHDYTLEVIQKGQRIILVVDDVRVIEHILPSPPTGNQLGLFAHSPSPVRFEDFKVQRRSPTAFIAMQFGEPYDTLYRTVIKPEAEELGFEVERIDELNRPGIIFQDIQQRIGDAKVVIAEITAPNQNVYYEVGYAHALNKPTILLAQRGRDLPFDIRSYRVIFYDDSIGGKPAVERTLREHLHSILNEL